MFESDVRLLKASKKIQSSLPVMVQDNIVSMSSISVIRQVPDMAAYTASKAGVCAFTDSLRADLEDTHIRVTEILPGLTRTNIILKHHRGDRALEQEYFEHVQIAQMFVLPVNRW